ncbi:DUF4189 domain-containing protein, partial [Roseomonas sp. GC11]|uniref:DUF4189 domain-containing protein n=1 Tax=Roseomonas sp. GC11 TaxID=2950546 RepID=UPI00210EF0F1
WLAGGVGGGGGRAPAGARPPHLAAFLGTRLGMAEGFLAGHASAARAEEEARGACEAFAGAGACRRAALVLNRCVALALSGDGTLHTGFGGDRAMAEAEARGDCGPAGGCELVASGC